MPEADLEIERLRDKRDVRDYLRLLRKVFHQEDGVDESAKKLIDYHPEMTLDNFFVVKHEGRMVSTINLIPVTWSIGDVELRVAEMGYVATLLECRGKGFMQKLVLEFLKTVAQQNFDLSVIEGIPYFYRQFGYDYALPLLEETRIRLDQIPDSRSNVIIRSFTARDIAEAMKLLKASQKKFYVHSVRSKAVWEMQEKTHIASDPEPF